LINVGPGSEDQGVGTAATTSEPGSGELLLRMLRLSGWLILTQTAEPAELHAAYRLPSGRLLKVTAAGPTLPDAAFSLFERACAARAEAQRAADHTSAGALFLTS
jgi:hypothetical protein